MDTAVFNEVHQSFIKQPFTYNNYLSDKIIITYEPNIILEYNIKYNNNITIICKDIVSSHLLRIIKTKLNEFIVESKFIFEYNFNIDYLGEFLFELNILFSNNIFNFCTGCGDALQTIEFDKICICDKLSCIKYSSQLPFNNNLSKLFEQDSRLLLLSIKLLHLSITHPKAKELYKIIPNLPGVDNFEEYIIYLNKYCHLHKILNISQEKKRPSNDLELIILIEKELYSLIKISINENFFSLITNKYIDRNIQNYFIDNIQQPSLKLITNIEQPFTEYSVHLVKLNYTAKIENKFNSGHFLFHGAPLYTWYYIIKNGLKIMSGTNFQAHGAAYGNGIYLSDSFYFASKYSDSETNYYPPQYTNVSTHITIIGMFEIINDPLIYKKTNSIFVVPNDENILLRYLIVIPNNFKHNLIVKNNNIQNIQSKINNNHYNHVRLDREYNLLLSEQIIQNIEFVKNYLEWKITFINNKFGIILIHIIFNDYPINPPTLKFCDNKFINLNKNKIIKIYPDLTIEMDEINPINWTIKNNLSKILIQLNKYLNYI